MLNIIVNEDILFYAFRYALGRQTYSVSDVVQALLSNWSKISKQTKLIIIEEIHRAVKNNSAGMVMDVMEWTKILNLEEDVRKEF